MSLEASLSQAIQKHGFQILRINDHHPPFAYTVGLMFSCNHPELLIAGLPTEGPKLLRLLIQQIRSGHRFDTPGEHTVVNFKITTAPIAPEDHPHYLGYAMGYCREQGRPGELQALQIFWPDPAGHTILHPNCTPATLTAQRLTGSKPTSKHP